MTTNISIMDDGYNHISQPVMGVYALYQPAPQTEAPVLGTVEPEAESEESDEAKAAKAEAEAKVVTNPGKEKAAAKPADASAAVETK